MIYRRLQGPVRVNSLHPVTELENTLSAVDADAISAVQRNAVVETELVPLAHALRLRVRAAVLHLCTRSHSCLLYTSDAADE